MNNAVTTRRRLLLNGSGEETPFSPSFSPLGLPGLWAWYDAGEIATVRTGSGDIAGSGAAVAVWQDRSGGERHLHDIGEAFRPLLRTSPLRCIAFDRDALQLWLTYAAPVPLPQPVTVFVAGAFTVLSEGATLFDGSTDKFSVFCGSSSNLTLYAGAAGITVPGLDTAPHIFTAVFDGVSSSLQLDASAAPFSGSGGTNSLPGLRVGGDISGGVGGRLTGFVCELIVVSGVVDPAARAACRSYLSAKWL